MKKVGILMGSANDKEQMQGVVDVLAKFGVGYEWRVLSAHRTPDAVREFVTTGPERGIGVFVCGAGMAAHLAGAVAAQTTLPVIGVPLLSSLDGLDALLATVQMPPGLPVATVAIGGPGAKNAGYLAVQILAVSEPALADALRRERAEQAAKILAQPAVVS
jgi:phosphoribosylaminoimidazole carboxylase PurE protein